MYKIKTVHTGQIGIPKRGSRFDQSTEKIEIELRISWEFLVKLQIREAQCDSLAHLTIV